MSMKTSWLMDYTLWIPFHAFKIYGYPLLLMLMMYLYPLVELDMRKVENVLELEQEERLNYDPYFILTHFAVCYVIIASATKGL